MISHWLLQLWLFAPTAHDHVCGRILADRHTLMRQIWDLQQQFLLTQLTSFGKQLTFELIDLLRDRVDVLNQFCWCFTFATIYADLFARTISLSVQLL